jgi:hypothetical protein
MAMRAQGLNFRIFLKNLIFIITELPFARRRAEAYLNKIIHVGQELKSQGFMHGQALFNMGLLLRSKGNKAAAMAYFNEALLIFQRCCSVSSLKRCQEALDSVS